MPGTNLLKNKRRLAVLVACLLSSLTTAVFAFMLIMSRYLPEYLQWGSRTYAMTASTGFVIAAIAAGALWSWHGRFMLVGLICCWLGDYLGLGDFSYGMYAFLFSHFAFIAAYLMLGISWRRVAAACAVMAVVGVCVAVWLMPHVPRRDLLPVVAYMTVISLMVACAAGIRPPASRRIILVAAVVFFISDIFVARWKFVQSSSLNALFCYPLYYSSCLTLALSLLAYVPGRGNNNSGDEVREEKE